MDCLISEYYYYYTWPQLETPENWPYNWDDFISMGLISWMYCSEGVSPLRIMWRWFPIAVLLRSGTSATGFVTERLPHYSLANGFFSSQVKHFRVELEDHTDQGTLDWTLNIVTSISEINTCLLRPLLWQCRRDQFRTRPFRIRPQRSCWHNRAHLL